MGALSGTLTYKQYRVEGDLPEGFRDKFVEALQRDGFREINIDGDDDRSIGWVTVENLLDAQFSTEKLLFTHYLCVALREDVVKVPANTLKVYLQKEEIEVKKRLDREKLTKSERDELRELVQAKLRRKALPSIRTFDVVWDLNTRSLWFWSQNRGLCDNFEELFENTFGMSLVPYNTYCGLEEAGLSERDLERVVALEPADFVGVR